MFGFMGKYLLLDSNLNANEKLNLIKLIHTVSKHDCYKLNGVSIREVASRNNVQRAGITSAFKKIRDIVDKPLKNSELLREYLARLESHHFISSVQAHLKLGPTDIKLAHLNKNFEKWDGNEFRKQAVKALLIDDYPYMNNTTARKYDLGKNERVLLSIFYVLASDVFIVRDLSAKYLAMLIGCERGSIKPILVRLEKKGFIKKLLAGGSTPNLGYISPVFSLNFEKVEVKNVPRRAVRIHIKYLHFASYGAEKYLHGAFGPRELDGCSLPEKVSDIFSNLSLSLIDKKWLNFEFDEADLANHQRKNIFLYSIMSKVMTAMVQKIASIDKLEIDKQADSNNWAKLNKSARIELLYTLYTFSLKEVFGVSGTLVDDSAGNKQLNYKKFIVLCSLARVNYYLESQQAFYDTHPVTFCEYVIKKEVVNNKLMILEEIVFTTK